MNSISVDKGKIFIVDDNPFSRMTVRDLLLLDGYEVLESDSSPTVINTVLESNPDLIILEPMMPQIDGFEVCKRLKEDERTCLIPVVFISVTNDRKLRLKCIESGGADLLTKPVDRFELSARIRSLIKQKRLNEELDQTEQVLFSLAKAIENRYSKGSSSVKLADLAQCFGKYLQLSSEDIQNLLYAAHLHDIGTVAIPDEILLKKGQLTVKEREIISEHVLIGEKICQPIRALRGVLPIIRHHHERWDGSGYPDGLRGAQIPLLAQVFQIIDIYDALTSERPHKSALSPEDALEIISQETSKGWRNPKIVEQFTSFIDSTDHLVNQATASIYQ